MRLPHISSLCAATLALSTFAHSLSIHGPKKHHAHGRHHMSGRAAQTSSVAVSERDVTPDLIAIELINNLDSADARAYIQTTSEGTDQKVLITADGTPYHPVANGKWNPTPIPQNANCGIRLGAKGSSVTITMPIPMLTGRIYISDGELDLSVLQGDYGISLQNPSFQNPYDPNFNTSYGFVEANQAGKSIYVNPTYVDFVGLPMGMELVTEKKTLGISGLPGNGVGEVCRQLAGEQEKDGYPWGELCLKDDNEAPIRVLSPQHNPDGFKTYFDDYINQVWQYIAHNGIKFDTQDGQPIVSCRVQGHAMTCDRDSLPFPKPTTADVWGCNSGPFAQTGDACHKEIGARFCAAFHRATFLLPGGDVQPGQNISSYYPQEYPHNKYSRIVHQVQVDHHGYTFPFDDVKPTIMVTEDEVSGSIATDNVRVLRVIAGGPDGAQQPEAVPVAAAQPGSSNENPTSSAAPQGYSAQDTSAENTESSTITSEQLSGGDASTYATKSPDAPATSTASNSAVPASVESLTTQAPTTMITLPSQTTAPAHPGDSPVAYSPLAGATTTNVAMVTIIETVIETTSFVTTTTVFN